MGSPNDRSLPAILSRHRGHIALFAASAYLISPVLFHALRHARDGGFNLLFAFNLACSVLWLGLLHTVVRRPFLLHALLFPLYVVTAIDLFLIGAFGSRLSTGYVSVALSNFDDTGELLRTYSDPIAVTAAVLIVVYVPCLVGMWRVRTRRSVRGAAAIIVMLLGAYTLALARDLEIDHQTVNAALLDVASKDRSSPFGALLQGGLALGMRMESMEFRQRRAAHSFAATQVAARGGEVYVWVIGESSRPLDWSLFGYGRKTTPMLDAMSGVVAFPHLLTTAPHTSIAVPSMLSLRPVTNWPGILAEHSVVEAFHEVGFKTYWLSAQAADSWAGLIPQIAAEADQLRYYDSGHDGAMLPQLRSILAAASPDAKLFIVMHTNGSHFEYSRRYPAEFARFSGGKTGRERLVDDYDNSVLYTDYVLSQIIATLVDHTGRAAVLYASDHGENLLDDDRQLLGHALGTTYDLHTAALVWISDELARSRPQQMHELQAHATAKLSLSNLPHSLLDLAGIHTSEFDPRMSVFSDQFMPMPRSYIVRGELRSEQSAAVAKTP